MITILGQLQVAALLGTISMLTAMLSGGAEAAGARTQLARVRREP